MIEVRFRFFGAMREFGTGLDMEVPAGITVRELKDRLAKELGDTRAAFRPGILAQSAIGDERAVLADSDTIKQSGELAVLPPVCGG